MLWFKRSLYSIIILFLSAACQTTAPQTAGEDLQPRQNTQFTCLDQVDKINWSQEDLVYVDKLYEELIIYLKGISSALSKPAKGCQLAEATIATAVGTKDKPLQACIEDYPDMKILLNHINAIISNPQEAKKCFDPKMRTVSESYRGLTPHSDFKKGSLTARWVGKPLFSDKLNPKQDIHRQMIKFGQDMKSFLNETAQSKHFPVDISARSLKNLWWSAGWIPFYIKKEVAGNHNFRGGYAYAELVGPWGMMKIDTINGEKYQGEIGMTAQRAGSFYPGHFHHSQEFYMTLSKEQCPQQFQYLLIDQNGPLAKSSRSWKKYYRTTDPEDDWFYYIDRAKIHSFSSSDCGGRAKDGALVGIWARTWARSGVDQSTVFCTNKAKIPSSQINVKLPYTCNTDQFETHNH